MHGARSSNYADKRLDLESAIGRIKPGRRILIGSGAGVPTQLVDGLCAFGQHLSDNEIVHLLTLGPAPYAQAGMEGRFRHTAFFIGPNVREAVAAGRADFMPVFLSEIPRLIQSRRMRVDVALIQVSPPDARGYVSLGVSVDIVRSAVAAAELVIAEVNPYMPRTLGDSFLHLSQIDALIEVELQLPELAPTPQDPVYETIGQNVARLIPDGATIQTGIGRIPDAVARALLNKHDLGVHTEMLPDGVMQLAEAGVITGNKKSLLPGKIVTSFIMGSRALYEWANDNPGVEMRPSDFTNDPFIIARHDNFMAINAALAIDLTGQVAADTLMGRFFSGIGGQVDFIRGASRSFGGKAIVALPSTAKGGQLSRIQPALEEGAGIVTSRGDVHYVVTEYGVADLFGKNIRQRAMALIEIAHPDHRSELLNAAKARRYVFADQLIQRAPYPSDEIQEEQLSDGSVLWMRPTHLSDDEGIRDLFYRVSEASQSSDSLAAAEALDHDELQRLLNQDYEKCFVLLVTQKDDPGREVLGLGRYEVDPATGLAKVDFLVRDDWHSRGIGTRLLKRLSIAARERGVVGLCATIAGNNYPMLQIFHRSGLPLNMRLQDSNYLVEARFESALSASAASPARERQEPLPPLGE